MKNIVWSFFILFSLVRASEKQPKSENNLKQAYTSLSTYIPILDLLRIIVGYSHNWEKYHVLEDEIHTHAQDILSVAFSPNNKFIASGLKAGIITIRKHKNKQFKLFQTLENPVRNQSNVKYFLSSTLFSPNGKYFVSGSDDKSVKIYELQKDQFELQQTLREPCNVKSIAFSPDTKYLASGFTISDLVHIWELHDNHFTLKQTLDENFKQVNSLAFSPHSTYLACGAHFHIFIFVNIHNKYELLQILDDEFTGTVALTFSPDGNYLASGSPNHAINIWHLRGNKFISYQTLHGHKGIISSLIFSADGNYLASGSWDNTIKLWTHAGQKFTLTQTLTGPKGVIHSLAFSPNGKYLAAGLDDHTTQIYKNQAHALLALLKNKKNR